MSDAQALRKAAAIHAMALQPKIRELLEGADASLPDFGRIAPGAPELAPLGNLADLVDRIGYDGQAANDVAFVTTMYCSALVEIISAQQQRINEMDSAISFYRHGLVTTDT